MSEYFGEQNQNCQNTGKNEKLFTKDNCNQEGPEIPPNSLISI